MFKKREGLTQWVSGASWRRSNPKHRHLFVTDCGQICKVFWGTPPGKGSAGEEIAAERLASAGGGCALPLLMAGAGLRRKRRCPAAAWLKRGPKCSASLMAASVPGAVRDAHVVHPAGLQPVDDRLDLFGRIKHEMRAAQDGVQPGNPPAGRRGGPGC